jgi:hypothetical protein
VQPEGSREAVASLMGPSQKAACRIGLYKARMLVQPPRVVPVRVNQDRQVWKHTRGTPSRGPSQEEHTLQENEG